MLVAAATVVAAAVLDGARSAALGEAAPLGGRRMNWCVLGLQWAGHPHDAGLQIAGTAIAWITCR
jgi:hypothetical protein